MKKQDPYELVLLTHKWRFINIDYEDPRTRTVNDYRQALGAYFYLKGVISNPNPDEAKDFMKALYKEIHYLQSILFTDRYWNNDLNQSYQEVTMRMRWEMIYKLLAKGKLRDLYDQWENPPVQLVLNLGV